jgi:uncharacterized protein (DUF1330 family)
LKAHHMIVVSLLAGITLGALGSQALRAQAKPAAYVVGEIEVADTERYFKEYVPTAAKAVIEGGGTYIVRNGKSLSLYGEPPEALAIMRFESMEKAQAAFGDRRSSEPVLARDGAAHRSGRQENVWTRP